MSQPTQASLTRLEEIVGTPYVVSDAAELAAREVCGERASAMVSPVDAAQIAEIIRFAAAEKLAIIPTGGCTKLAIGSRPSRYDIALDLSRLNRLLAYDPKDLTLGVEPGVRIADLLAALGEQNQFVPLAVPFAERSTVGGIVATNASSPLRHAYGAVRDFCLGMEFVTGEGAQAKSGGRVVKNVTGYDLHKLLIGSLGTLAIITRVNFRTFPLPQAQKTFIASFSAAESAFEFCRSVAHSVLTPQLVEVADPSAGQLIFSGQSFARILPDQWSAIVTAAGQPAVVERYAQELGHMAAAANATEFMPVEDDAQRVLFDRVREFPRLALDAVPNAAIFRLSSLPAVMPVLTAKLNAIARQNHAEVATLTRASGIVYAVLVAENSATLDSLAKAIPEVFRACGQPEIQASAMLEWCPQQLKTAPDVVWGTVRPDVELMRRVKQSFDPQNVLAPGRFAGGI
ncbi:MAG TPA: FAD-binding oxidoreductase [Candidatus Acidoferrales bacterium]|jgi:glycolate oxidase FAD binding subunit|nr:FAD-binding oxidoreductase [Candidatus Acidoferrales bacterium]